MTPDEYEARLVDRLEASATAYPGWWDDDTPPRIALDAYADWLRLRAVAGSGCARVWVNERRRRDDVAASVDHPQLEPVLLSGPILWPGCGYYADGLCSGCTAQRRMAELLAAAEVTA